ncbi:MAG: trehalose-phosphatase [SAR202 cluster bacterium]|nr:trehalose-phosphatase [SAR202 cluster bacterium]
MPDIDVGNSVSFGLDRDQQLIVGGILLLMVLLLVLNRLLLRRVYLKATGKLVRRPVFNAVDADDSTIARWFETAIALLIVAIAASSVLWALEATGVDVDAVTAGIRDAWSGALRWLGPRALRIAILVAVAYVLNRAFHGVIPPLMRKQLQRGKSGIELEEATKRAAALTEVAQNLMTVLIATIVFITALAELGINIAPILATVGIAGIALGFGAQHLVKDLISGAFIIGENQYGVGDVAAVGGKTGLVESVNLRRTVLRDLDGIVHIIPNGEITTASNYTRNFSRVNLDIRVSYQEDLDKGIRVINRVGSEVGKDDYFSQMIIESPQVLRVNSFDDSGVAIKVVGVTKPIRQWEVTGDLRRRLKREFDLEGIEIPVPHLLVHWGDGAHPRANAEYRPPTIGRAGHDGTQAPITAQDPSITQSRAEEAAARAAQRAVENVLLHRDAVREVLRIRPSCLFTDIDGTLARNALTPASVKITPAVREALGVISQHITVEILTGRDIASARALIGLNSVVYAGNHGFEVWEKGNITIPPDARALSRRMNTLSREAKSALASDPSISVEDKNYSVAIHYRKAHDPEISRQAILAYLANEPQAKGFLIQEGNMAVEVKAQNEADKGRALKETISRQGARSALVIGDDFTDVDGFKILRKLRDETGLAGLAIAVRGTRAQKQLFDNADFQLADAEEVELFLTWLAAELERSA